MNNLFVELLLLAAVVVLLISSKDNNNDYNSLWGWGLGLPDHCLSGNNISRVPAK